MSELKFSTYDSHLISIFSARIRNLVESPMKRMMEKGKGKRRTQTKCRANKRRKFAAQSTREAEETKADHRNNLQHTEAARMLPALGFCFHTRFRHRFRFGFGTNCWAALRRGWRLSGTAGLCRKSQKKHKETRIPKMD